MFTTTPGMFIADAQGLVLNVNDFGVWPSSSASQNSTGIAAAIAALPTNGPGTLFFPLVGTGSYIFSSAIVIDRDNISLIGSGNRLGCPSISFSSDLTYGIVVGNTKNVNNVVIRGLDIQGQFSTTSTGAGINFRCTGGQIKECRVAGFGGTGINVAAFSSTIFEVYIEDVTLITNGMNAGTPGDNLVIANSVTDFEVTRVITLGDAAKSTTRHGINCAGGPGKFLVCHPYFCNQDGLHITGNGNVEVIGGEYETNAQKGLNIVATNNVAVSAAVFFANTGADLATSGTGPIVGNMFQGTNQGIYATFFSGQIADNFFVGNATPIWLDTGCILCDVHDNYIQNSDPGIKLTGTVNSVHDNTIVAGGIAELTGANNNNIHDNFIASGKTITIVGTTTRVQNNPGFNPVGQVTAPGFPATTVAATNTTGVDVTAFVANGTSAITQVQVAGVAGSYVNTNFQIAANGWGAIRIPVGGGVKFTFGGGAPAWTWFGE